MSIKELKAALRKLNGQIARAAKHYRSPYALVDLCEERREYEERLCALSEAQNQSANTRPGSESRSNSPQAREQATALLRNLWRVNKTGGSRPIDPFRLLDPRVGIEYLGYKLIEVDSLGVHNIYGKETEVAGEVDSESQQVLISRRFGPEIRKFTAAHELGHIALDHLGADVLHRDIPVTRQSGKLALPKIEREANAFASEYLMPERLVRQEFDSRFKTQSFSVNESTAFALSSKLSADEVIRLANDRNALAELLATSINYDGEYFASLSEQFGVSKTAMAIRLTELNVV